MIIKRHKSFIKDFKKITLSDSQFNKFIAFISALQDHKPLPEESLDHALNGNFQGYREFHLGGDMLVVYKRLDTEVTLVAIGSHNQIFKK